MIDKLNKTIRPLSIIGFFYPLSLAVSICFEIKHPVFLAISFFISSILFLMSSKKFFPISLILISFSAGLLYSNFYFTNIIDKNFSRYHFKTSTISGEIKDIIKDDNETKFNIKVKTIDNNKIPYSFYVSAKLDKDIPIEYSDKFICNGKIEMFYPNKIDYNSYNCSNNIFGKIKINYYSINKPCKNLNPSYHIMNLREKIANFNREKLSNDIATITNAIVLGYNNDIDSNVKLDFNSLSASHILVVSGLHLSMIGIIIYSIFKKLLFKSKFSGLITILLLFIYAYMTGFNIPVERAFIMFCLYVFADTFSYVSDSASALGFASIIIISKNPISALSLSFILSYFVTLAIIYISPKIKENLNLKYYFNKAYTSIYYYFLESIVASISAYLALIPFNVFVFDSTSFFNLVLNIILIPLCQGIIIFDILSIILCKIPIISDIFITLCQICADFMINIVNAFNNLPITSFFVQNKLLLPIISFMLFLFYILIHKNKNYKTAFWLSIIIVNLLSILFLLIYTLITYA